MGVDSTVNGSTEDCQMEDTIEDSGYRTAFQSTERFAFPVCYFPVTRSQKCRQQQVFVTGIMVPDAHSIMSSLRCVYQSDHVNVTPLLQQHQ